jgi:hypothetical protein
VSGVIDFEDGPKYEIFVKAQDGYGLSSDTKVIISISDVNDNAPVFQKKDVTFKISESAVSGAKFILDRAINAEPFSIGATASEAATTPPANNESIF